MAKQKKRKKAGGGASKPRTGAAPRSVPPKGAAASAPRAGSRLDPWLIGLAGLGIALTAYLTAVDWFGAHPAYCGADSGCDLVQSSRWSTLLGLPMAFWGLLTYALIARSLWRLRTRPSAWRFALLLAAVGTGVSWFLTAVSVFEIEALCGYCLASLAIMNMLLILIIVRRPAQMPEHAWSQAVYTPLGAAAAVVLALQLHFSGVFDPASGPEDPFLSALAVHLRESGARFYGAYWCPRCQEQKALFEASVKRLPYVECTPDGRSGPRAAACLTQNIQQYPTWIIGTRRATGVLSPELLADMSGFELKAGRAVAEKN